MTKNTTDDFLPKDYQEPASNSRYMKFEDGENKFRFLSSPIIGFECWKDSKPYRFRSEAEIPNEKWDINTYTGEMKRPTFFWAAVVWDYSDKQIKILEITQTSIRKAITGLINDPDWGNPKGYDIKVDRTKNGDKTEYSVRPGKLGETDPLIIGEYGMVTINLEALFEGGDPFAA